MFKKLIKVLLCCNILLSGLLVGKIEAKANDVQPYAAAHIVHIDEQLVFAPVYHANYGTSYYLLRISGEYTYNIASTGNYVSGVQLTISRPNAATYKSTNTTSGTGYFEVTSFSVRSYSAASTPKIRINYKVNFKELGGTTLGSYNGYVDAGM